MRGFAYVKDVGQVSYGMWDHPELRPVFEEILGHATGNATSDDPAVRARMKWEYLMLLIPFLREFPEFAGPGGVLRTTVDHRHFFFNGRVDHETVTLKKAFADFALDHVEVPTTPQSYLEATPQSYLEAFNEARRAAYEKTRDAGLVDIETDLARMEMTAACKRVAVRAWQRAELDAREEKRAAAAAELAADESFLVADTIVQAINFDARADNATARVVALSREARHVDRTLKLVAEGRRAITRSEALSKARKPKVAVDAHETLQSSDKLFETMRRILPEWNQSNDAERKAEAHTALTKEVLDAAVSELNYVEAATGCTPLLLASNHGAGNLVEILVGRGADVDATYRKEGLCALHFMTYKPKACPDAVDALLAAGADPNIVELKCGLTPLHYAADAGDLRVCQQLVLHGADVNALTFKGAYPATYARNRDHGTCELFLARAASCVEIKYQTRRAIKAMLSP